MTETNTTSSSTKTNIQITVHWLEKSRSQRILWLLEELNLNYKIVTYKRDHHGANSELKKIHPLGKSPVITLEGDHLERPIVLAESGAIIEYLCRFFGQSSTLVPPQFPAGVEEGPESVGLETEAWRRSQFYLQYAEGSFMPLVTDTILAEFLRSEPPFPVSFFAGLVAKQLESEYLSPQFKNHYAFLEKQLKTSGGSYLCGPTLSAADIMMSFPLQVALIKSSVKAANYPLLVAYVERLENESGYKKAIKSIEATGEKWEIV